MISSRYALPVIVLLSLALIPTVIHSYFGAKIDDGLLTKQINMKLGEYYGKSTDRNARWGDEVFNSQDWIERTYSKPAGFEIRLFVARSFDHKSLYHHPELALSYGRDMTAEGIVILPGEPELPVHLLRENLGSGLIAYTILYEDEFVQNPISLQILSAFDLLFNASKPMTLFYISTPNIPGQRRTDLSQVTDLLHAAIESFRSQKTSNQ